MPRKHIQVEIKIDFKDRSTVIGGIMGGRHWDAMWRVLVDGEAVTDWLNRSERVTRQNQDGEPTRVSIFTRLSKATGWSIGAKRIERVYRKACKEWSESKARAVNARRAAKGSDPAYRVDGGKVGRKRLPIPPFASSGGMGWSSDNPTHYVLG